VRALTEKRHLLFPNNTVCYKSMKLKQIQQVCNIKMITALVDTLLTTYDTPKVYSEDPSVDISRIAMNLGILGVIPVPCEELEGNHAIFENSNIKIDKDDPKEKQVFSIAHEIGHIVLGHIDITAKYKVARHGISRINEQYKKIKTENIKNIISVKLLQELVDDRLADFFAASLLVPINRFLLWEDKQDDEIAAAFGVEVKCIGKRRQEIKDILPELVLNTHAIG